ncbi:MAG: hypothetical protein DME39_03225 [Verrucomicrobia bacterium]|nr:MAG: hypothetical protein DME95_05745 [Verrucomicrobiota bacterium]PYK75782.1 MAG: hypothetical protein DME39_03225 [Verrucomicrobiota bacterium]
MKPTPQISHNQRGSGRDNGTRRSNRRLLLTDYNYHPTPETQMGSSAGQPVTKLPPFHKLSSELLGVERSRDYVAELLLFVLITGIAAWPVVSMLIAVTRLVRNY